MIYFDNSATTLPYPEALRTFQEVSQKFLGTPLVYMSWEVMRQEFYKLPVSK